MTEPDFIGCIPKVIAFLGLQIYLIGKSELTNINP
jgi:hypothetical protein